jgi:glycosyltransferase involved in cell wall biosynthesis
MKIHLLHTHYPHWGAYSGSCQFLKYLDLQSFHVDIHPASDSDNDFPIRQKIFRHYISCLFTTPKMPWYKLSDLFAEFLALGKWLKGGVDILHYLDGEHSARFLPRLSHRISYHRPVMIANYHQPNEIIAPLVLPEVVAALDAVVVMAPNQADYFQHFIPPEKIHFIPHGIDTLFFQPDEKIKEREKLKCITVGHWLRDYPVLRKTAEILVDHPSIEFHVISGKSAGLDGLENITHHQGLSDTQLRKSYQQANILFLPLTQCTANNALLEGMACGLPVVATDLPAIKTYVSGDGALLISKNNPQRFAEAILELFHHPEKRIQMGRAARKKAETLNWLYIARQYQHLYTELFSQRQKPGNRNLRA